MKLARPDHEPIPTPREIDDHLSRYVIGQERARRAIALAAYSHMRRIEAHRRGLSGSLRKSNVLLIGPTGSGKTLLARHLAEIMRAPFSAADATEYTEAGYYGKDVELMISDLYASADHSVEETERGVVFIDEIDKIARRTQGAQNGAGTRDIGGEGVQQALLKMLEGRAITVPTGSNQPWARNDHITIDTTHILFVCAGTFSDLLADRAEHHRPVGFGQDDAKSHRHKRIRQQELVSFGMLAEFLGRLPIVVELDELGAKELLRVLTEPKDSLLGEMRDRLALDGVDLVMRHAAMQEIARHAIDRKLGARGLRSIVEDVCGDVLFDAPTHPGRRVVIDAAYVRRRLREAGETPTGQTLTPDAS
jgi:ATP-dependent Clp protease ATP-binding subunit ClpX